MDDYVDTGIYGINCNPGESNISNFPNNDTWKAGQLVVLSGTYQSGGYQKTQIFYSTGITAGAIYQRHKWSTIWSNWQRIDNYRTTSLSELASALGVQNIDNYYDNGNTIYIKFKKVDILDDKITKLTVCSGESNSNMYVFFIGYNHSGGVDIWGHIDSNDNNTKVYRYDGEVIIAGGLWGFINIKGLMREVDYERISELPSGATEITSQFK